MRNNKAKEKQKQRENDEGKEKKLENQEITIEGREK